MKIINRFKSLDTALNEAGFDRGSYEIAIANQIKLAEKSHDHPMIGHVEFDEAFVTDAVDRHGQPVIMYSIICDGVRILHKFSIHSTIDGDGFQIVEISYPGCEFVEADTMFKGSKVTNDFKYRKVLANVLNELEKVNDKTLYLTSVHTEL